MALSHFKVGSQSDYDSLQTKDSNTLYFITDSGASRIYKGETLMATYNDDYVADNTDNNITITINNNTHKISADLTSGFLDLVNNAGSQWGEIPISSLLPSGNYIIDGNIYGFNQGEVFPLLVDLNNNQIFVKVNNSGDIEYYSKAKDDKLVGDIITVNNIPSGNNNFLYAELGMGGMTIW